MTFTFIALADMNSQMQGFHRQPKTAGSAFPATQKMWDIALLKKAIISVSDV